jgi:hypothetical protein
MPIFNQHFYDGRVVTTDHIESYRLALRTQFQHLVASEDRFKLLRQEVSEVTRHITNGVRDIITKDKRIRNLVLNQGAVPLGTWTIALDTMATYSLPALQSKIAEMKQELEHGKVEGFPATMFLFNKPTFTTFEPFYTLLFDLIEGEQTVK